MLTDAPTCATCGLPIDDEDPHLDSCYGRDHHPDCCPDCYLPVPPHTCEVRLVRR